jgi:hypothetical protein
MSLPTPDELSKAALYDEDEIVRLLTWAAKEGKKEIYLVPARVPAETHSALTAAGYTLSWIGSVDVLVVSWK